LAKQILEIREVVSICCLPFGQDPNDILKTNGQAVVQKFLNNSITINKFGMRVLEPKFSKIEENEHNWIEFYKSLKEFKKNNNSVVEC
jgi:DNA primase